MITRITLFSFLVFSSLAFGQVKLPDVKTEYKAKPGELVLITIKGDDQLGMAKSFTRDEAVFGQLVTPAGSKEYIFQVPMEKPKPFYTIAWWITGQTEGKITTITVTGVGPAPTPVDPVVPDPVVPTVAPIPLPGYRVLLIYEKQETDQLTPVQFNAVHGKKFRDFVEANCVKASDGTPERRILDQNADMSRAARHWQDVMKRPRTKLPWIVISNGVTGFEGELPATEEKIFELLNKYLPK